MYCVERKKKYKSPLFFLFLIVAMVYVELSFAMTGTASNSLAMHPPLEKRTCLEFSELKTYLNNDRYAFRDQNKILQQRGYTAGDEYTYMVGDQTTYGPTIFGNLAKQQSVSGPNGQNVQNGYTYGTGGLAILTDAAFNYFYVSPLRLGLGISYAQTVVKTNITNDRLTAGMFQMLAYGTWTYRWIYIDGSMYYGLNNYRNHRNISRPTGKLEASGKFAGLQYGGKLSGGISVPIYTLELTPMGEIQYTHVTLRQYTETGATGFNLTVPGREIPAAQAAVGVKLMEVSERDSFLPEIYVWYIDTFKNTNLIQNSFINLNVNGPAFPTPIPLSKHGLIAGGGITARLTNGSILTFGYDLEMRKNYTCNNGYLKLRYIFMGGYSCCD